MTGEKNRRRNPEFLSLTVAIDNAGARRYSRNVSKGRALNCFYVFTQIPAVTIRRIHAA